MSKITQNLLSKATLRLILGLFLSIVFLPDSIAQSSQIQVNKKDVNDTTPNEGDTITYSIEIENKGPDDATNVIMSDLLPAGLTFVSATEEQGTYNEVTGEWNVGTFTDGDKLSLTIVATVDADTSGSTISNTISLLSMDQTDPDTSNNSFTRDITVNAPDLTVTKTVNDATPDVGQTITYTVTVKNNGNAPATGVQITDLLPADLSFDSINSINAGTYNNVTGIWDVGSINTGTTYTLKIDAIVNAGTTGFTITNIASVTALDQNDSNPNDNSDSVDVVVNFPDIQITKTVSAGPYNELQNVTYTINVENIGDADATGLQIIDIIPGVMTYVSDNPDTGTYDEVSGIWDIGNLNSGQSTELGIVAFPNIGTSGTDVANTASLFDLNENDTNFSNNSSTASILVATSDLELIKTGPASAAEGDTIAYRLQVTNNGDGDATNITVEDVLPPGLTFVGFTSTPVGVFSESGGTITWTLDLADGSNARLDFQVTVDAGYAAQTITNIAEITDFDQVDPNRGDNESSIDLLVDGADLEVTKTVDNLAPNPGDTVVYTITVTNNGHLKANNITIFDALPAGVTFVSAVHSQGNPYEDINPDEWFVNDLNAGASATLTITATVDAGTIGSSITNTASVLSVVEGDSITDNNSDSATIAIGEADLGVTKTASAPGDGIAFNPGEPVSFTISVENYGPHDAPLVEVLDVLPPELTFLTAVTISGSYDEVSGIWSIGTVNNGGTANLTILATVNSGATTAGKTIVNTATVSSPMNEPVGATNPNTDSASIQVHGADLAITKTTTALPPIVEGDPVNYTVTVTNNGPDDATNIEVTDFIPINFDDTQTSISSSEGSYDTFTSIWSGIDLLVGESATLNISSIIESGGGITNTATITAVDQADSNQDNNSATVFISALKTFDAGSCIINMGGTQTYDGTLKVYGLIYTLVKEAKVPVWWSIRPDKTFGDTVNKVDEVDFTANGVDYISGAFIIDRPFVADAQAIIDQWSFDYPLLAANIQCNQPADFQAPIHASITSFPRAVLDSQNGGIAESFFYDNIGVTNEEVPVGSGNFTLYRPDGAPSNLAPCDDIYTMPHADPHAWDPIEIETYDAYVKGGGWVWLACHAVSSQEALVDIPSIPGGPPQMNYLTNNGLIPWGDHDNGTLPYSYSLDPGQYNTEAASDPFMQFIGNIDAALQSGSEQIYIPVTEGWRPTTTIGLYDPDHPDIAAGTSHPSNAAALIAYGHAYGNPDYGMVMYEGSHSVASGSEAENVGAARVYGNFWLQAGVEFRPLITPTAIPVGIQVGQSDTFAATVQGQVATSTTFTYEWISSCSGTFTTPNAASTEFTPDPVSVPTECIIRLVVSDECGRQNFLAETYTVYPITDLSVSKTATATAVAGQDTISYDITVENVGSETGYGTNVEDVLPTGTTFVSATPSIGTFTAPNWAVGDMAPGAVETITITATVDSDVADGSTLDNTATVTTLSTDNNATNDTSTASTTVSAISDLVTIKTLSSGSSTPDPGDAISFTITVNNVGPSDALGVSLTDVLPAGLTLTGNTPSSGSYNVSTGLWDGFNVAAGTSETLVLNATVDLDQSGQTIQNLTTTAVSTSPLNADTTGDDLEETINVTGVVTGGNPTAQNDDFGIIQDSGLNVLEVLLDNGNGPDDFGSDGPNNGTIEVLSPTSAAGATISVNDNGTPTNPTDDKVNYTTIPGYNGSDNFDYRITDGDGDASTATARLTILPDADGDGIDDITDLDDDNDGILDTVECTEFNSPRLLNGDFEDNDILLLDGGPTDVVPTSGIWKGDASNIPDWESADAVNNHLEVWHNTQAAVSDFGGVAYKGTQWAEINATTNDGLYQDVATTPGDVLQWSFAHRKRTSYAGSATEDIMTLLIGDATGTLVSQGDFTSANDASWTLHTGTYTVPPGQTTTRLTFAWVSSASGSSTVGNFIDDVQLYVISDCEDSDGDTIPDYLDLDSDNDGIYDVDEAGNGALDDNNDGVIDVNDTGFTDTNTNGVDDDAEITTPIDTGSDGSYDFQNTDSDGDGCFDALEGAGTFTTADLTSSNNLADTDEGSVDSNGVPTNAGSPQATTAAVTDNLDNSACCYGGEVGTDQNRCWGDWNVDPFTSITPGSVSSGTLSYQWQISTTDCTTGFTDIAGATSETYDHGNVFTTTYFRRVTTNGTDCTEYSNCITVVMNRIAIYSTVNNLSCIDGPNDGSIDVSISGTVGAYSVSWSNGATTEDISGLAAGDYTITVTDASGCPPTQATITVGTIENPYAALLLTGTTGATPFPTSDYPVGSFPPDAVPNGEPGGYNQTYPTGSETFNVTFDNYYMPEDYIIDPDWAGSATMTYTQDHGGTSSNAFFAAGSRITEFSDFGPGAIANNSGNTYYVYGRGLNAFSSTGFVDGWTLNYDFTGLANGYLPAGTLIALTDVDGVASGGENAILNATLASGATTAWLNDFDNSLTTPPHGAPTYDSGTNSYNFASVSGAANGNWVLITTEDLFDISINITNNSGGSIGLKMAAPVVPIDVTLTGTDNNICFGPGVDGQIQVDILGSVGPYDIAWDNGTGESGSVSGEAGPYTITNLPVGTYTVTVSAGSCSAQETVTLGCPDIDNDGISNIADLDDDNDGILDLDESGIYNPDGDEDGDGIPNWQDTTDDGTGDGSSTDYVDANGDGVPDVYDLDGDGIPNHLDLDSDNDGCSDSLEAGATTDTTTDFQYPTAPVGTDGVPDAVQTVSGANSGNVDYTIIETNAGTYDFLDAAVTVACGADLSLTKTINNATPRIGETIIFTITLTNSGPFDATGVQVRDLLPTGMVYVAGSSTIPAGTTYNEVTGIWDLSTATVNNGSSIALQIAATITPACGEINNVAEIIASDQQDPDSIFNNGN